MSPNRTDLDRERIADLKARTPKGTRVELVSTNDAYTTMPAGTAGTVLMVDDRGTVHVQWDTGTHLGLIEGEDSWKVVPG